MFPIRGETCTIWNNRTGSTNFSRYARLVITTATYVSVVISSCLLDCIGISDYVTQAYDFSSCHDDIIFDVGICNSHYWTWQTIWYRLWVCLPLELDCIGYEQRLNPSPFKKIMHSFFFHCSLFITLQSLNSFQITCHLETRWFLSYIEGREKCGNF